MRATSTIPPTAGSDALGVQAFRVEVLVDGVWQSAGTVGQNSANPARLDLSGAPRGIQQARLVFTQPSPTDNLARVFEMEIYGWR